MWIDLLARNEAVQLSLLTAMLIIGAVFLFLICVYIVNLLMAREQQREKAALLQAQTSPTSQFAQHRKVRHHG